MKQDLIIILVTSFSFVILFNYFFDYFVKKLNIYDYPDNVRKKHKYPVPLVGGFILFISIIFYLLLEKFILSEKYLLENLNTYSLRAKISFLISFFLVFLIGLYDDIFKLSPLRKLILLSLTILFFLIFNENYLLKEIQLYTINYKISLGREATLITILCFITLLNFINFYDGINFQLLSFFIIINIYLIFILDLFFIIYLLIICIFLAIKNLKNKLFMGDSGSFLIAFILGTLFLINYNANNIKYVENVFAILSIPFFDMIRVISSRFFKKESIVKSDNRHVHYVLTNRFSLLISNLILCVFQIIIIILQIFNPLLAIILSFIFIFFIINFIK